MCVSEREAGKKGSDCNLFLSYFISERHRASVKYSEKSKMIPAQLMQKVGHLGFALRRDLLTHQSCQPLRCLCRVPVQICLGLLQTPSGRVTWWNKEVDFHKVITY